jgi:flagellin-like hook-associated protein FlgL
MQIQKEESGIRTLSNIKDLDVAKEIMEKAKNQMLLETNIAIFSESLDNHRNYILQLLR